MERSFRIIIIWIGILALNKVCDSVKFSDIIYGVDLCDKPLTDPCTPGGKWDPLLERFVNTIMTHIGSENLSFLMLGITYTLQFSLQIKCNQYTGAYILITV